ncbi:hypothetical protein ANCCEY_02580 [Ancylostoma ceylanicum]|uniref:Uncharacterized protein n=1 Tax=Ancylostoma ceylanicum TaxID=53326 RepID=A0A0D6M297_9BILA|nr:hypothetical protein ANCCEY_02580 [Ancylostoma ceylanicum]
MAIFEKLLNKDSATMLILSLHRKSYHALRPTAHSNYGPLTEMRSFVATGAKMGESEVEMKETPPAAPPPTAPPPTPPAPTAPPPTAQHPSVPTIAEEGGDVDVTPGPTPRVASAENLPHTGGRRISSVEAVKGAPPPKRTSVVVFETPDVRKPSSYASEELRT